MINPPAQHSCWGTLRAGEGPLDGLADSGFSPVSFHRALPLPSPTCCWEGLPTSQPLTHAQPQLKEMKACHLFFLEFLVLCKDRVIS